MQQPSFDNLADIQAKARCLCTPDDIDAAIKRLASSINTDFKDKKPVVLCVMVGGMATVGRLLPHLTIAMELDYIHATRYGMEKSADTIEWRALPKTPLTDRHVIVIDDILDGGITLGVIQQYCEQAGSQSVHHAVLLDKPAGRSPEGLQKADYVGITIGNHWIFGTGLDYFGYWRNVDGIYTSPE